ncbi:MAG: hypothetical protein ACRENH_02650, partial [Gemmatimonadaceae bacterium]
MRSTDLLSIRNIGIGLIALAAVACTDSPTSVVMKPISDRPLLAVVGKPPINQSLEGEVWICKDGTGPATNFAFSVSIDGGAAATHSVALGTCLRIADYAIPTPPGRFFHTFSVTETVPTNWNLNSIVIESNALSPSVTFQPVINAPNAQARVSHDWGLVYTFTNTFTPPSFCTATLGFWKNHTSRWNDAGDNKPVLTTTTFFNSGQSYLTILSSSSAAGNAYLILAKQYIAAVLNTGGGASGVASVDAAIAGAAAYFAGASAGIPNPVDPTRTQLLGWATTLDQFNNGIIGPG